MHNIIDKLKSMGVKDENIIFISFESREYNQIDDCDKLYYMKANISGGMQITLSFLTIFDVVFEMIMPWGEL